MANKDSFLRILAVIVGLCLFCSIIVCIAVVSLKPLQEKSIQVDREASILAAANIEVPKGKDISEVYKENIEARLLNLATGSFVTDENEKATVLNGSTVDGYDFNAASKIATSSVQIPADQDLAKIKSRAKYMPIYLVKSAGGYTSIILPVYGQGLWSTMYAYLSLNLDGNTIQGVKYYQHGETPGLGAEVENPLWTAKWSGKKLFDENGVVKFAVLKNLTNSNYQVDALSGATLTSDGVSRTVQYWADQNGYGPFLQKVKTEGVK
ncbi:MAG: Na(+)-translocating NADH-quinone reductase subunit C [Succinivibrionaceae bacterium]